MLKNMEDILHQQISGFHRYVLNDPIHLSYVSANLCRMLLLEESELLHDSEDRYARMVHPDDRRRYEHFLRDMAQKDQMLSLDYRLIRPDGSVMLVRDTFTSRRLETGMMEGYSVLTDITDISDQENLRVLNDSTSFGILRYTCEKQPKLTYINQTMIQLLRFPEVQEGELNYLDMYKDNIFLLIPMEERRRFSKYLNRVYSEGNPIAGEMSLLRCDGTRAYVFGWATKYVNQQGVEEFQSVCMDITERHRTKKAAEIKRYLKALTDVYDKIFEFNLDSNTVKCLHSEDESQFKRLEDIAMQIDDALEKWFSHSVSGENANALRRFFFRFCQKKLYDSADKPPQITYRARSSSGKYEQYIGVFIKVDESTSFFCCRRVNEPENDAVLKSVNEQVRENVKDLVMRFSDGLAAFEVTADGMVKPLYASDNVCKFFGYTQEEWYLLTETYTPLENFVAYSEAAYDDFEELLRRGEAEFTYFDYACERERKIKAICSNREQKKNASRFIMLYAVDDIKTHEKKMLPENRKVFIRTFGYFDVFVGDKPIAFRNKKAKELFALLVDRKGGYITSEEAISFLWEDELITTLTLARYRKVALRLKNTLEEYGISDVLESVDGKRRIVMEKVQCDLYDYLEKNQASEYIFCGSYLTNYSWAEITLGELIDAREREGK